MELGRSIVWGNITMCRSGYDSYCFLFKVVAKSLIDSVYWCQVWRRINVDVHQTMFRTCTKFCIFFVATWKNVPAKIISLRRWDSNCQTGQVYFDYLAMVPEQYDWLAKDLAAVNRHSSCHRTGGVQSNKNWLKVWNICPPYIWDGWLIS